ncbi:MAG TPA: arylsulfotransferase family protein [Solirubrobacteraceae bacterium]|nr:arylsulfotransferase family protein [Solirubrobacteraceae bacterium]
MSARRAPTRGALAGAPPALLAAVATVALPASVAALILVGACASADGAEPSASASRFVEPSVSPRCTPSRLNVSAALAGSRVTVSPAPESRDASVSTQLSMLGPPARELSNVTVSGSRSGAHPGRLLAYRSEIGGTAAGGGGQGDGASFVPAQPFIQGETVQVHADLSETGQHEGSQTIPFAWSFTTAVQDHGGVAVASPRPAPRRASYQHFRSRPELQPPTVAVTTHVAGATPGDIFLAPYSGPGQYGPMILDENGSLLYFKALSPAGARAADFKVQQYEGEPVLTWWQDPLLAHGDSGAGEVIADGSYRRIAVVRAGNGYQADLHEFEITPQGVGLITVFDGIDCDLSAVGGPRNAALADTLLQEIDLRTGLVMYEWHSLDHVPLSDSYASARRASRTTPFDFFHINALDAQPDGDLLVDARNTWAAYDVDPRSGQVRWELGGKQSSFAMGPGASAAWQHDARVQPNGAITLFDNGATPAVHRQSRAIELRLGPQPGTATLVREQVHPVKPLVAGSQGNVQALADGAWMVGWGESPYFSEFGANGQLLLDAHMPASYESYRAYRLPWSGHPSEPPALAVRRVAADRGAVVYASWNGATEVAAWRVLAGATPTTLAPVAGAQRSGFETAIAAPSLAAGSYVEAQALDAAGAVIGSSRARKS